jgi:hypothetical protein
MTVRQTVHDADHRAQFGRQVRVRRVALRDERDLLTRWHARELAFDVLLERCSGLALPLVDLQTEPGIRRQLRHPWPGARVPVRDRTLRRDAADLFDGLDRIARQEDPQDGAADRVDGL